MDAGRPGGRAIWVVREMTNDRLHELVRVEVNLARSAGRVGCASPPCARRKLRNIPNVEFNCLSWGQPPQVSECGSMKSVADPSARKQHALTASGRIHLGAQRRRRNGRRSCRPVSRTASPTALMSRPSHGRRYCFEALRRCRARDCVAKGNHTINCPRLHFGAAIERTGGVLCS